MKASTKKHLIFKSVLIKCQNEGAGELILYNIDRDGTREGYDFSLIDKLEAINFAEQSIKINSNKIRPKLY